MGVNHLLPMTSLGFENDMKLIELDLTRGDVHDHPEIKQKASYLARIHGEYFCGQFSRQWYGWNFDDGWGSGHQYDKPGTNCSQWEKLWEIDDHE